MNESENQKELTNSDIVTLFKSIEDMKAVLYYMYNPIVNKGEIITLGEKIASLAETMAAHIEKHEQEQSRVALLEQTVQTNDKANKDFHKSAVKWVVWLGTPFYLGAVTLAFKAVYTFITKQPAP